MTIGLSSYAFFWRHSSRVGEPMTLADLVVATAAQGCEVLQLCDERELGEMSPAALAALASLAGERGVELELGVRGTSAERVGSHLQTASSLGARLVRTMVLPEEVAAGVAGLERSLRDAARRVADAGVTLALETYEAVATDVLVALVETVGSEHLGICLDPANVVARLEHPDATIACAAACTVNLHVKDFRFERAPGLVGFSLTGCPLGTGQLDLAHLYEAVRPHERDLSEIVEHWLPWQGDEQTTIRLEEEWTAHSLARMRAQGDKPGAGSARTVAGGAS